MLVSARQGAVRAVVRITPDRAYPIAAAVPRPKGWNATLGGMIHGLRSRSTRLSIPALLAVSALGIAAGCPGDDQDDTGNESGPSPTTTTGEGSTTAAADSTTVAGTETTAADSTTTAAETDTGELPDCQANADEVACEGVTSCVWLPELGGCIIDCTIPEDEATCMEQLGCAWYGDFCDFEPIA